MRDLFPFAMLTFVTVMALPLHAQDYNIQLRNTLDYPGQTLANICGYAQNGREYALVGASKGLSIVDVTDPENIYEIVQIPGPNDRWREIKTYSHYAYVTTEGGGGVQIVDLSGLPGADLAYHSYTDSGRMNNIHALHIDVKKGFLYTYGGNQTTALAHDLKQDPFNPVYAGRFDQLGYVHDGYAENDTLYACHINSGVLSVVDMRDKQKPVLLGTVVTPGRFTHNSWLLSDHRYILTTDEEYPSFVTAYDISDPGDIRELDRIARDGGMQSIGHNTHVINDWAVTSWYTDGVTIVDAHRPINLVQVGRFDTWASGGKFDGCWGVYPFLPSGNLIATNIPVFQNPNAGAGRLFVLTPGYVRACYLEGKITNGCNGQPLIGADIKINHTDPLNFAQSDNFGIYRTGQPTPGDFTVTISKPGYITQTLNVTLQTAAVTELNLTLEPAAAYDVEAVAMDMQNGTPVANADIILKGAVAEYHLKTDAEGKADISCLLGGNYRVGTWGFQLTNIDINSGGVLTIPLLPGYYDDFELDLDWTFTATASAGYWERDEPAGTFFNGELSNPDSDADTDFNDQCYVTGNGGGQPGTDDVDNGTVVLTSPTMRLGKYSDAILNFYYWFFNDGGNGGAPNDNFSVVVSNGQQTATVLTTTESQSQWRYSDDIHLKDFLPLTDNMQVSFVAVDQNPGHLVEAAVDIFQVTPGAVSAGEPDPGAQLHITPNPSNTDFRVNYNWPDNKNVLLEVRNQVGQLVSTQSLPDDAGSARFGENLPAGVYLVMLRAAGRQSAVIKAVKQ